MGALPSAFARAAGLGDGVLTVRVVRDVNANGQWDQDPDGVEPALTGQRVRVVDAGGQTVEADTGAGGTVVVNTGGLTGGRYRVELTSTADRTGGPGPLQPAFAGDVSSNTAFADVSGGQAATVTMAVWNPADYAEADPGLVTASQPTANQNDDRRTLLSFGYGDRGEHPGFSAGTTLATKADTGSLYGIAYQKSGRRIFSGAYAKRHANYGPGGPGAIYVTPRGGTGAQLFTTVPDAGATPHADAVRDDALFFSAVGTESLGDLDLTEDGTTLYVVNQNNKKLLSYDATLPAAPAPKQASDIPNPCADAADWRPSGLGFHDGVGYLGGVCSAATSRQEADLRAIVLTFDPATGQIDPAPIIEHGLAFERGTTVGSLSGDWFPWVTNPSTQWIISNGSGNPLFSVPQPMLTDIDQEIDGDLVLGFRDRGGDMSGASITNLHPAGTGLETYVSGGDLVRVCRSGTALTWEGEGTCPDHVTPANSGGEVPGIKEWYPGDHKEGAEYGHQETAQGATALAYPSGKLASTQMNPVDAFDSGGVAFYQRFGAQNLPQGQAAGTKATADGYGINYINDTPESVNFGKANGLADLELMAEPAPVQIGNRTWFDRNDNGRQDPDEPALPGVTVILQDSAGATIAQKQTDAAGEYYFGPADGLLPDTDYTVVFDKSTTSTAGLPGVGSPGDLRWAAVQSGDPRIDSTPTPEGPRTAPLAAYALRTGAAGFVDHTIDAGLVPPDRTPPPSPTFTSSEEPTPTPTPTRPTPKPTPTVAAPRLDIVSIDGRRNFPYGRDSRKWVDGHCAASGECIRRNGPWARRTDADTPATAARHRGRLTKKATTYRLPVEYRVTNIGTTPATGLRVTAGTLSGAPVNGLTCTFPDGSTGRTWTGTLKPGGFFDCEGTTVLKPGRYHGDRALIEYHRGSWKEADRDCFWALWTPPEKKTLSRRP